MPKRTDIRTIAVLGSGPIVIGQACEFDYSGTQACRVLRREGYRVVLVNSNPATIMTDPEFADATYVEPLVPEIVEKILEKERPDALLPTVGGQTGINLALALHERGTLERLGIELLGAGVDALRVGEDRELFKEAMEEIGLRVCRSGYAGSLEEAREIAAAIGYPIIVRPSFTLGGEGGGTCYNRDELEEIVAPALEASPVGRVLLEESVLGWKEFELEVIRDHHDNAIVVCSVENFDAMGVHTGDSITVAPQQTLTDREYQEMRDDAFAVIRRVGVATGGSNIQFAVDPQTGDRIVIEMNPRVSRSSALASKATGFPIAKVAALLAVGYTLDEIPNEITGKTYRRVRADARLHGGQDPALGVREVPRRADDARHLDEVGRRGDGDRRHLRRGADEGAVVARARRLDHLARGARRRPGEAPPAPLGAELGAPVRHLRGAAPGVDGRGARPHHPRRPLVPARDPHHRRARSRARLLGPRVAAARAAAARQVDRRRQPPARPARRRERRARSRAGSRPKGCAASSSASTPAPPSSRPRRRISIRPGGARTKPSRPAAAR